MSKNRILAENKANLKDARGNVVERFQEVAYYQGTATSLGVGVVVGFTMKSVWVLPIQYRNEVVQHLLAGTKPKDWRGNTVDAFEYIERCINFHAPDRVCQIVPDVEFGNLIDGSN